MGDDSLSRHLDQPDAALRLPGLEPGDDRTRARVRRDRHRRVDSRRCVRQDSALGRALRGPAHVGDVPRDGVACEASRAGPDHGRGARGRTGSAPRPRRAASAQRLARASDPGDDCARPPGTARAAPRRGEPGAERRVRRAGTGGAHRRADPAAGARRTRRLDRAAPDSARRVSRGRVHALGRGGSAGLAAWFGRRRHAGSRRDLAASCARRDSRERGASHRGIRDDRALRPRRAGRRCDRRDRRRGRNTTRLARTDLRAVRTLGQLPVAPRGRGGAWAGDRRGDFAPPTAARAQRGTAKARAPHSS